MVVRKASEDYLEAMLMLQEQKGYIRSVDIAVLLGVSKPSVSYATKRLREAGYITMDEHACITLSPSGAAIAERIYHRHKVLTDLLIALGVQPDTARADACKIEHELSDESFAAISRHIKDNRTEGAREKE